ncbi:MAG: hypothetical protein SFV15_14490 [Polyangiaceae bacterium]|nr:hypothetical protein [Polyangiaceae bacterium]
MSIYSLAGRWQFRAYKKIGDKALKALQLERWMPAHMPGTLHYALEKLGKIPDAMHERNELSVQWVDEQDWELVRNVRATVADCRKLRQELVFNGLDTIVTIYLNGKKVGRSVNMFRQVVCDVAGVLVPGENELKLVFESPTAYAAAEYKKYGAGKGILHGFVWQTGERRQSARKWIRKAQCQFGWDWGLYLATSGMWQPAFLECSNAPRVASVQTQQTHHGRVGRPHTVELSISTRLASPSVQSGELMLSCGGQSVKVRAHLRPGETTVKANLTLTSPELWWPAGEGPQKLYELCIEWHGDNGDTTQHQRRLGLRTIELVTENDSAKGEPRAQSFFFRVNGRAIFARGADWIPVDPYIDRAKPGVYRHLLSSMVEANMNMVRVWGGGYYEQDIFYDLCDEKGLLIWQDFMMACALYPDRKEFIAELVAEAKYQVRRLHDRPSLALWCGDNENAAELWHNWLNQPIKDPVGIYKRTLSALKKVCEAEDTTRRFWLSSPSNNDFEKDPADPRRGNVHSWNVWHGRKPFKDYLNVKPRFVSEFGFQSFPEPRTIRSVVAKEHCNPTSRVMEHHQRAGDGNMLITNAIARELPIPKDFDSFCWASQINQAQAIRTAVEHWRRLKPYCGGALFWQLNDLWPVASWSSIDYYGRWKALQHEAVRFFSPLLTSLVHEGDSLQVWVTSDLPNALSLAGELEVLTWSGQRITRIALKARVAPQASRKIATLSLAQLLGGKAEAHEVCCFVRLKGSGTVAENCAPLVPWKWVSLEKPRTQAKLRERAGRLELVVENTAIAPFFHAELKGTEGHFQGDWQVLPPGTHVLPYVYHEERGQRRLTLEEAQKKLRTFSLYDLVEH